MTIKELMEELKKYDENMVVCIESTEDCNYLDINCIIETEKLLWYKDYDGIHTSKIKIVGLSL